MRASLSVHAKGIGTGLVLYTLAWSSTPFLIHYHKTLGHLVALSLGHFIVFIFGLRELNRLKSIQWQPISVFCSLMLIMSGMDLFLARLKEPPNQNLSICFYVFTLFGWGVLIALILYMDLFARRMHQLYWPDILLTTGATLWVAGFVYCWAASSESLEHTEMVPGLVFLGFIIPMVGLAAAGWAYEFGTTITWDKSFVETGQLLANESSLSYGSIQSSADAY